MLKFNELKNIVEGEKREMARTRPQNRRDINSVYIDFLEHFQGKDLNTVREIMNLCLDVDLEMDFSGIDPELLSVIGKTRKKILGQMISAHYDNECEQKLNVGSRQEADRLMQEKQVALIMVELVPQLRKIIQEKNIESFNQNNIQIEANGLFDRLRDALRDPQLKRYDWEMFKDMLPDDLRKKFIISARDVNDNYLKEMIRTYRSLIEKLGPEVVFQFILSLQDPKNPRVKIVDFARFKKIIPEFLGAVHKVPGHYADVTEFPEALLDNPEAEEVLFLHLRNAIYAELVKEDSALGSSGESYHIRLLQLRKKVDVLLKSKLDLKIDAQQRLYDKAFHYFEEVLSYPCLPNMERFIADQTGRHYLPSLRQRIAVKEIKDKKRMLVGFFMGQGKTATAFLAKEHIGAKKMLYVCPTNIRREVEKEIAKYYKPGQRPSIGLIEGGMEDREKLIAQALEQDVVVVPYSMLTTEIVEELKKSNFDMMVVDEVQEVRNEQGRNTEAVHDLANGIPNLYENGNIILLSGDPTPNSPEDIVPQLRLLDNDKYGEISSLRQAIKKTHPLEVRNSILRHLLILEQEENWAQYVDTRSYALHGDEMELYNDILFDMSLPPQVKLQRLHAAILNPSLYSPYEVESSLFQSTVEAVEGYLAEYPVVVVAENMLAQGVTREHEKLPGINFAEQLANYFKGGAQVHVIDGKTTQTQRDAIMRQVKSANENSKKEGANQKVIVFAMSGTMRQGTNEFATVNRAVLLEPTFNRADTVQFVKRFARGGNSDVQVTVLMAEDTLHVGVDLHAQNKYVHTSQLKYGGSLTDNDLDFLDGDKLDETIQIRGDRVSFGTEIFEKLTSPGEKLHRLNGYLHGRGSHRYGDFVEQCGEYYAQLYMRNLEKSYAGNNARFVGGMINMLERKGLVKGKIYADLGCGPLTLENTLSPGDGKRRVIYSTDLNGNLMHKGRQKLQKHKIWIEPERMSCGSITDLSDYGTGMFDLVNCALALEYTRLETRIKSPERDERVRTLVEANRVLREGGIYLLTIAEDSCTPEEFTGLCHVMQKHFGFEIMGEYTGSAESVCQPGEPGFQVHCAVAKKVGEPNLEGLNLKDMTLSRVAEEKPARGGKPLKRDINAHKGFAHTKFRINRHEEEVFRMDAETEKEINEYNQRVYEAAGYLRVLLIRNGGSLLNLKEEDKQELKRRKISVSVKPAKNEYRFRLWSQEVLEPIYPVADSIVLAEEIVSRTAMVGENQLNQVDILHLKTFGITPLFNFADKKFEIQILGQNETFRLFEGRNR